MGKRKDACRQKLSWPDFCRLISGLTVHLFHSYEIVDSSGRVVAVLIGEDELKRKVSFSEKVDKFLKKHADDFKEAQTLILKLSNAKKSLKQAKKESAEAKRRTAKFQEITEKVKKRVYGKPKENIPGMFDGDEWCKKLKKSRIAIRKRREDQEDLKAARKALKDKRPSIPFEKLRDELGKKDAKPKKRSNKKGQ